MMKLNNPSGRSLARSVLAVGAAAAVIPGTICDRPAKKPNIIYILADDLGYGDLSCYGQEGFQTPNIDRLAAEGLRFTQHYAGSTVCAPSRCSLMTGLHTGHAQIRGNKEYEPIGQYPLAQGTMTVARLLKGAGYTTGLFGKWGLGYSGNSGDPLNQGFDTFFGYNCQINAHDYYPEWVFQDGEKVTLDGRKYAPDLIMDKALEFIEENRAGPFFCYIPVIIPHAPMLAPEAVQNEWRSRLPQFDGETGSYAGTRVINPIAAFPAVVTYLDGQIGHLMQHLKDLGIDDNTLVIFSSDNGPHSAGGHDPEFWNSSGPLRGNKRDLYEGGIRVPMIARWPSKIKPGGESDHVSAFWDILPTMAEIAGLTPPADIDGISFLPTLLSRAGRQRRHEYLYWESTEKTGKQAIRKGNFKAVRLRVDKNPYAPIELYDLDVDPGETRDISDRHPEIVDELSPLFTSARTESEAFPLFEYTEDGAAPSGAINPR